jgi:hypothetical protein
MRTASAILLVAMAWAWPAVGKTLTVRGEGAATCASWTNIHMVARSDRRAVQDSWVLGYVNGVSGSLDIPGMEDVSAPLRNPDLVTWIGKYCSEHPDVALIQAADALMRELARRAVGGTSGDGDPL